MITFISELSFRKLNYPIILLSNLVFFFILFPYLSPFRTSFDTQPYGIFFAILFFLISLAYSKVKFNYDVTLLFLLLTYSFFIFFTRSIDFFSSFRSLTGYVSFVMFTYFGYLSNRYLNATLFNVSILIWFFFGFIQFFFYKSFGSALISSMRTTPERGVTSLAVEPSFYSIICFFMMFINDFFYSNNKISKGSFIRNIILLVLQIFISFSGIGFLFLFIFFLSKWIIYFFFKKVYSNLFIYLIVFLILFITFPLIISIFDNIRGVVLLNSILNNPLDLILNDYSFSIRFVHMFISITNLFNNLSGYGLGNWNYYVEDLILHSPAWIKFLVDTNNLYLYGRILSGWGSLIFELGVFGLIPIIILVKIFFKYFSKQNKMYNYLSSFTIFLFIIMLMAIPISFPFFGFSFGILLFYTKKNIKV
jgi:hypothetical protein